MESKETKEEEKVVEENVPKNTDYYDENGRPKYEEIIKFENEIRNEIELTTPLVSELFPIEHLYKDFENSEFEKAIPKISEKYEKIRTVRRDGNCFYRAYLYRLFEELGTKKDQYLNEHLTKIVTDSKDLTEKQGISWIVFEDFYTLFLEEINRAFTIHVDSIREYLDKLFSNKEKSNYLIVFVRLFISAYLKENRILYESFIFDDEFNTWVQREVEAIDNECDQVQIMAIVNAFDIGVAIEYLNPNSIETMKFPEEGNKPIFIHMLFRPGHYDILYPKTEK